MRQSLITIAALAAVVAARDLRSTTSGRSNTGRSAHQRQQDANFATWAAEQGRGYKTTEEFNMRKAAYVATDDMITEWNEKAKASGNPNASKLGHNSRSDMTEEEKNASKGHIPRAEPQSGPSRGQTSSQNRGALRQPKNINWHEAGATGGPNKEVYQQGSCGSCFSFAANRVLEGTAFAQGLGYERVSEQHIVSCDIGVTGNEGCNGGWMERVWEFQRRSQSNNGGVIPSSDYAYTSGNGNRGSCQASGKQRLGYTPGPETWHPNAAGQKEVLIDALYDGPISIAVKASGPFSSYSSGIFSVSDCGASGWNSLDHGITLVGYYNSELVDQVDPADPVPVDPNPVDPNPVDPDQVDPVNQTYTETMVRTRARKQLADDLGFDSGCRNQNEEAVTDGWCITTETTIHTIVEEALQRQTRGDVTTPVEYWIALNSWGNWGEGGLIKLAVQDTSSKVNGVCGMYLETQSVEINVLDN